MGKDLEWERDDARDTATATQECIWAACTLLVSPAASRLVVLDLGCCPPVPPLRMNDAWTGRVGAEEALGRVARALKQNTSVQCFAYGGIRRAAGP